MKNIIFFLVGLFLIGTADLASADKTPQIVFSGNSFGYINPCPS